MRTPDDLLSLPEQPCACGIGRAARVDIRSRFPKPGRCYICRMIAAENPDWSDPRVAEAGKARWERALAAGAAARAAKEAA